MRAGWNYGKSPLSKSRAFENIAFPAIAEHHLTAGLGFDITRALTLHVLAEPRGPGLPGGAPWGRARARGLDTGTSTD